ncbi:cyclic AMP-dependent transcription factor ATF-6 beta isoform X2 [Struthio camelus]|uniref:cyclic AMP-dependent transcription factor ATF-6 beta isoform X2 n=1 Tax=Struthio camelus TaxID=8801 RepID=UPI00360411BD
MAALAPELLVLSDAGRFRADNLLGSEDWDAALYGCLDDGLEPAHLFPSLEPDPMFDGAFELGEAATPPDPPWAQPPPNLFPDLQVKSEPASPASSHCSESSGLSSASDPPGWVPSPAAEPGVKTEPPPVPPCSEPGRVPKGAVKSEAPRRTPPIQPKPLVVAAVPVGPPPPAPPKTILLQPLPGSAPPLPPAIAVPTPSVVISPAELLRLPGLLRLQPPGPEPPRAAPGAPRPEAKTIVPAPAPAGPGPQEVDVKVLKRQQRMIKNRESACQSRRKKKEYLQGLEARLREALADNDRLRRENALLRRRLDAVLGENAELRLGPGHRKLVCLAALLLFVAFNFGPLSPPEQPPPEPGPPRQEQPPPRARRHLLGVAQGPPEDGPRERGLRGPPAPLPGPPFRNASAVPALVLRDLDRLFLAPDCRRFNRTESLRLADELSGWVRRHQSDHRKPGPPRRPPGRQPSPPNKAPTTSRLVPAAPPYPARTPPGQLQLYRPERPEPDFLDAIDRREDTFYVVSFRRDHLLLPAISHNKTSRPKMSLVMPAAALNESLSGRAGGYEAMMQVDCEVMDTRVIHIKSSTVPPSLRRRPPPGNRTQAPEPPRRGPRRPRALYLAYPGQG